jgi:hypothetical protein
MTGYERVATFGTAAEAEVVRGLLEASGIEARVGGTDHLAREHIPSGGIAVLVRAEDVRQAQEIIASARAAEPPASAPRVPERPGSSAWASAVIVGLMFSVAGALALLLRPGRRDSARAFIIVGLVLAVAGTLGVSVQRARRARGRR